MLKKSRGGETGNLMSVATSRLEVLRGFGGAVVMCGVEGGGGHDVGMGMGKEGEGIGGIVGLLMQREKNGKC